MLPWNTQPSTDGAPSSMRIAPPTAASFPSKRQELSDGVAAPLETSISRAPPLSVAMFPSNVICSRVGLLSRIRPPAPFGAVFAVITASLRVRPESTDR